MTPLHRHFETHARRSPERPALAGPGGATSYGALDTEANRIAAGLRARGVGAGDLIGLCLDWTPDLLAALLGCWKAGAAYVPLDPEWPAARLLTMAERAAPRLVIAPAHWHSAVAEAPADLLTPTELAAGQPGTAHELEPDPRRLAYVMFTSGTGGRPKGVMVSHGNLAGLFAPFRRRYAFSADDVWSLCHSYGFGYSVWETWGALTHGGCLVPVPSAQRADPAALQAALASAGVTILSQTPSAFQQTLLHDRFDLSSLPALRLVALSGEALPRVAVQRWLQRRRKSAALLINTYAITETAGQLTCREYRDDRDALAEQGDVGEPLPGIELRILDSAGRELPDGETGELYVGGPGVALGYLREPELTAETFVRLPRATGERIFYRSGDQARRGPRGELVFAGRRDGQLKWRGYRIEAAEVELALQAHPVVQQAAVGIHGDGEDARLVGYYTSQAADEEAAEFWPSVGPYQVYDEFLYDLMAAETTRIDNFRAAYARHARDRVVLDLGTGEHALLARLCAAAGARHVYAVEVLPEVAERARALVARLGLSERISVLSGDVANVRLPVPIELVTQGIVGNIGSADGIIAIWNSARRHFADHCIAVPARCRTLIAPAELPAALAERPAFSGLALQYAERVFDGYGGPFDIRLCVRNFPRNGLLAEPALFEDLQFSGALSVPGSGSASFRATRDGRLDGFLLWTVVDADARGDSQVDYLQHQQAWLPVFFPLPDGGTEIRRDEHIRARWQRDDQDGCPDYRLVTELRGETRTYQSRYRETATNSTDLHRRLWSAGRSAEPAADGLRDWLAARLPAYMIPNAWVRLPAMPLTANGKLDRSALPPPGRARPALRGEPAPPRDALETELVRIWSDALDLAAVGIEDNFFELGGDSISAVRLTSAVQHELDAPISLAALFDAPTVAELASLLRAQGHVRDAGAASLEEGLL